MHVARMRSETHLNGSTSHQALENETTAAPMSPMGQVANTPLARVRTVLLKRVIFYYDAEQIALSLSIAVIPALASIAAAIVSGRFAGKARRAEAEAARLRELEERLAGKKYDMYEPILRGLGQMLLPGNAKKALPEVEKAMPNFMTFVAVWGSDKALRAFSRYRLGSSTSPPPEIVLRLVSTSPHAAAR